jgi:hypothetical protein
VFLEQRLVLGFNQVKVGADQAYYLLVMFFDLAEEAALNPDKFLDASLVVLAPWRLI